MQWVPRGRECLPLRGQSECHERSHWMDLEGGVGVCQAEGLRLLGRRERSTFHRAV